jgi:hypothetical protein
MKTKEIKTGKSLIDQKKIKENKRKKRKSKYYRTFFSSLIDLTTDVSPFVLRLFDAKLSILLNSPFWLILQKYPAHAFLFI